MIRLPYFKFFPTEWLLGEISDCELDLQGAFIQTCCFYWRKECEFKLSNLEKKVSKNYIDQLIELEFIEVDKIGNIKIKFLDEQYIERNESHSKLQEAGRKGGLATQRKAKLKPSQSKGKVIKENNIIEKTINHPDPSQRMSRERAEKILNIKTERKRL